MLQSPLYKFRSKWLIRGFLHLLPKKKGQEVHLAPHALHGQAGRLLLVLLALLVLLLLLLVPLLQVEVGAWQSLAWCCVSLWCCCWQTWWWQCCWLWGHCREQLQLLLLLLMLLVGQFVC